MKSAELKGLAIQKLQELFGDNFVGSDDKRTYIEFDTDEGKQQVAFTLTCPKVPFERGAVGVSADKLDDRPLNEAERNELGDMLSKLGF